MNFKDWISYIMHRFANYIETPRVERKELKLQRKEKWSHRWFGLVPFSMKMYVNKQRHRINKKIRR
ncbi:YqzE family protein [Seinonella peptonophila]|nr:YqzE family protein [Seinonella peptonophila]